MHQKQSFQSVNLFISLLIIMIKKFFTSSLFFTHKSKDSQAPAEGLNIAFAARKIYISMTFHTRVSRKVENWLNIHSWKRHLLSECERHLLGVENTGNFTIEHLLIHLLSSSFFCFFSFLFFFYLTSTVSLTPSKSRVNEPLRWRSISYARSSWGSELPARHCMWRMFSSITFKLWVKILRMKQERRA